MPQPTAYVRNYDFTNFQEQFPDQSLPAAPLDANLDMIGISIGQIIARGALIQRDDGALKNKVVTPDSLSTTVLALLGSTMDPRGDWAPLTEYGKLNLVEQAGATYISTIAHTSSSDFATDLIAGYWMLFSNPVAEAGSSFFQEITGTGAQTVFTMNADLGIDPNAIMFFLNTPDGFDIKPPSYYTINGTQLTISVAPGLGVKGYIFAPSLLLGAASSAASAAQAAQASAAISQSASAANATNSQDWAVKTNGIVQATDYSSKAYAIGGTGVTDTATRGAAKEWATKTGSTVDTAEYSSKEYAVGDVTANGGSAKAWAMDSSSPDGTTTKSSKTWATEAAASAAAAASSAAEGLYENLVTITNANSPYVPAGLEEGTLYRCDTTGGNIVINLSSLATYGEDMKYAFVKIDNTANTVTINRGSTDTINGQTSLVIVLQYETHALLGDLESGTWADVIQSAGIADNTVTTAKIVNGAVTDTKLASDSVTTIKILNDNVTNAKLANMGAYTLKGNSTNAPADPIDITSTAFFMTLVDDGDAPTARGTLGAAGTTQGDFICGEIDTVANRTYNFCVRMPFAATITAFTTYAPTGSCSAALRNSSSAVASNTVNTTILRNTTLTNASVAAGNYLDIVVTSNSGCKGFAFVVEFNRTLA